tara:strand:- start:4801 stop:5223 length:423 start_codon:yes stop_codon:yes gene_type:complete
MSEIYENDLVMIFISKQSRETDEYCDYKICKVLAVGVYDLICEASSIYSSKLFKISKKRCAKLERKKIKHHEFKTHDPQIGDLVITIHDRYKKERETFTGIVENIVYDPSDQFNPIYNIRIGQETIIAYLENIIVLETSK